MWNIVKKHKPASDEEADASVGDSKQFGRIWYLPIAVIVLTGYGLGLYGWYHCGLKPVISGFDELDVRQIYLSLFSVGLIGGSMHCSKFLFEDANKAMYSGNKLPSWLDSFGYAMKILGGGVTGVVFYLVIRLGIGLATEGKATEDVIVTEAGWVMAFAGGFATDRIREFVVRLVQGKVGEGSAKKSPPKGDAGLLPPEAPEASSKAGRSE